MKSHKCKIVKIDRRWIVDTRTSFRRKDFYDSFSTLYLELFFDEDMIDLIVTETDHYIARRSFVFDYEHRDYEQLPRFPRSSFVVGLCYSSEVEDVVANQH